MAIVKKGDKLGIIDRHGKMIVPCLFDDIDCRAVSDGILVALMALPNSENNVAVGKKWVVIDAVNGKQVFSYKSDDISYFSEGLIAYKNDGKWGFINRKGEKVIPCSFSDVRPFSNGMACVILGEKWGVIDKTGKAIVDFKYDNMGYFSEGFFPVAMGEYDFRSQLMMDVDLVAEGSRCGFVDQTGKSLITDMNFHGVGSFNNGVAPVCKDKKWGLIDKTGRLVAPCVYAAIVNWKNDLVIVMDSKGMLGVIDRHGRTIAPCKYKNMRWISNRFIAISDTKRNSFDAYGFSCDRWGSTDDSSWKAMDLTTGTFAFPQYIFHDAQFSEGLTRISCNGKCGFANKDLQVVIPCLFDEAYHFSEGLAVVMCNNKAGFIDRTGKVVIPCKFDMAYPFSNGLASVIINGYWGYIRPDGSLAIRL